MKPAGPNSARTDYEIRPGGLVAIHAMPLQSLVSSALDIIGRDRLIGLPAWADTDRYDISAKAPQADPAAPALDSESLKPMLRNLLIERFGLMWHRDERPVIAWSLVSAKPRMKTADPSTRTSCSTAMARDNAPPGSLTMTCRNVTMAQFAEYLQYRIGELLLPVLDSTGIAGGWDFSLIYSPYAATATGSGSGAEGSAPALSDPSGALTLFEAVQKQLGLKLEKHPRKITVFVIDHLEQRPTEN